MYAKREYFHDKIDRYLLEVKYVHKSITVSIYLSSNDSTWSAYSTARSSWRSNGL